jgi:peroxiredoxin family protein/TusA-related sulfurtransferase
MCPGPIMKVYQSVREMNDGDVLEVRATDTAFGADIEAWCKRTENTLLEVSQRKGQVVARIQKGKGSAINLSKETAKEFKEVKLPQGKTMVVFSGELDKAIASFIIANGAASMGRKVTMFFTFWGLNVLRKSEHVAVKKTFIEKMFGMMMPRGSKKLGLSKMNMAGMGSKMIRGVMKSKNVSSLEELIEAAINNGVEIIACQMSMDIMGITQEELIDGVKFGGVAAYLGEAEESNVNLFI